MGQDQRRNGRHRGETHHVQARGVWDVARLLKNTSRAIAPRVVMS